MLVTGIGVGAPLAALFLVNQRWSGSTIRHSIAIYYVVIATFAVVLYAATGLYTLERLRLVLTLAPAALVGVWLASKLVSRLDERALRHVIVVVVVAASLALLGREIARI